MRHSTRGINAKKSHGGAAMGRLWEGPAAWVNPMRSLYSDGLNVDRSARREMSEQDKKDRGLEKGLTNYGDRGFSLFLRKAFIKGAGYTDDALSRPVVGIVNTGSSYNP